VDGSSRTRVAEIRVSDKAPKGEDIIRFISAKKNEPEWMLEWRLDAYKRWLTMDRADLGARRVSEDRLQRHLLLSAPKSAPGPKSLDEVDPELLATYEKLGIPLREQEILAGVEPKNRVASTPSSIQRVGGHHLQGRAEEGRRHLLSISEALREHPGAGEEVHRVSWFR
jgi:Fe-S cluster assembly protein SufB